MLVQAPVYQKYCVESDTEITVLFNKINKSAHAGRGRQLANRETLPCSCDAAHGRSAMEETS